MLRERLVKPPSMPKGQTESRLLPWCPHGLTALPEAPVAGQQGLSKSLCTVIPFLIIIVRHSSKGVLHPLACVEQLLTHLHMCVSASAHERLWHDALSINRLLY